MIVECVKIIDKVAGELQTNQSRGSQLGKRYTVLAVENDGQVLAYFSG